MSHSVPWPDDLEARLRSHVVQLATRPRAPFTPEHAAARRYIHDHLRDAGYRVVTSLIVEPITQPLPSGGHRFSPVESDQCFNLITRSLPEKGRGPLVIVGAHYDTVPGSPGADDNASGIAAMLEVAAWLRPQLDGAEAWATGRLQLAAYDLEEYGMVGSADHAELRAPVRCMISLEMLGYTDPRPGGQNLPHQLKGYYPDVGDFIGVCGNAASEQWVNLVKRALKSVPGLPVESLTVPGRGEVLPQVRLSDHSSFWDRGLPALMITDTSFFRNPHYHEMSDTPETLDYPFLAKVTQGVGAAVLRLLAVE